MKKSFCFMLCILLLSGCFSNSNRPPKPRAETQQEVTESLSQVLTIDFDFVRSETLKRGWRGEDIKYIYTDANGMEFTVTSAHAGYIDIVNMGFRTESDYHERWLEQRSETIAKALGDDLRWLMPSRSTSCFDIVIKNYDDIETAARMAHSLITSVDHFPANTNESRIVNVPFLMIRHGDFMIGGSRIYFVHGDMTAPDIHAIQELFVNSYVDDMLNRYRFDDDKIPDDLRLKD